jgi:hypothetical protein
MSRKLAPDDDRETQVLSIRITATTRDALDREAARRSQAAGGIPVSAAAVARALIEQALSTPAPKPKRK